MRQEMVIGGDKKPARDSIMTGCSKSKNGLVQRERAQSFGSLSGMEMDVKGKCAYTEQGHGPEPHYGPPTFKYI